jgi:hypothetical protein
MDTSVSNEDIAQLERLYAEYHQSVGRALNALRSHGMNSDLFREEDTKVGALRRQIRELLGTATRWDEWE